MVQPVVMQQPMMQPAIVVNPMRPMSPVGMGLGAAIAGATALGIANAIIHEERRDHHHHDHHGHHGHHGGRW